MPLLTVEPGKNKRRRESENQQNDEHPEQVARQGEDAGQGLGHL
jgi:hypothetical protein